MGGKINNLVYTTEVYDYKRKILSHNPDKSEWVKETREQAAKSSNHKTSSWAHKTHFRQYSEHF